MKLQFFKRNYFSISNLSVIMVNNALISNLGTVLYLQEKFDNGKTIPFQSYHTIG